MPRQPAPLIPLGELERARALWTDASRETATATPASWPWQAAEELCGLWLLWMADGASLTEIGKLLGTGARSVRVRLERHGHPAEVPPPKLCRRRSGTRHPMTRANVYTSPDGTRHCRECQRAADAARMRREKAAAAGADLRQAEERQSLFGQLVARLRIAAVEAGKPVHELPDWPEWHMLAGGQVDLYGAAKITGLSVRTLQMAARRSREAHRDGVAGSRHMPLPEGNGRAARWRIGDLAAWRAGADGHGTTGQPPPDTRKRVPAAGRVEQVQRLAKRNGGWVAPGVVAGELGVTRQTALRWMHQAGVPVWPPGDARPHGDGDLLPVAEEAVAKYGAAVGVTALQRHLRAAGYRVSPQRARRLLEAAGGIASPVVKPDHGAFATLWAVAEAYGVSHVTVLAAVDDLRLTVRGHAGDGTPLFSPRRIHRVRAGGGPVDKLWSPNRPA